MANVVADALSRIAYTRTPDTPGTGPVAGESLVNVVELRISASQEWLQDLQKEYTQDITFAPILEHLQSGGIGRDITATNDKKSRRIRERAKGYILRDGLLSTGPQEKSSVSLGFCRPMSFGSTRCYSWRGTCRRRKDSSGSSLTVLLAPTDGHGG